MNDDIKWFLGLIAVMGLLWWGGRGALQGALGNAQNDSSPSAEQAPQTIPEQIKTAEKKVGELQEELKKAQADADASPLRNKLVLNSLSRNSSNPNYEYISVSASRENTAPVEITGLLIKSSGTGNEARVPGAWRLPFPNMSGEGTAVMLAPGETAYLISGLSPIGISFESNLCTGYFAQGASFSPSLSVSCPSPVNEPLPAPPNHLSDSCIDFLASIPSCTAPSIPLRLSNDGSCQAHITKNISYDACVRIHKNEPGFYSGVWYLYLNRTSGLWKEKREGAALFDQNNKLIDSKVY